MVGLSARLSVVCVPGSPHINGWRGLCATQRAERRDWRARASLAIRYQNCASTEQTRKKTSTEPLLIPRYGTIDDRWSDSWLLIGCAATPLPGLPTTTGWP